MAISINAQKCPQNHRCPLLNICPAGAITQQGIGLPEVDQAKCTNCGKCTRYCGMGAMQLK